MWHCYHSKNSRPYCFSFLFNEDFFIDSLGFFMEIAAKQVLRNDRLIRFLFEPRKNSMIYPPRYKWGFFWQEDIFENGTLEQSINWVKACVFVIETRFLRLKRNFTQSRASDITWEKRVVLRKYLLKYSRIDFPKFGKNITWTPQNH